MKRIITGSSLLALCLGVVSVAHAFTYTSTNAENIANEEGPYVEEVDAFPGEVTLSFGNYGPGVHCFEYRTDGDTSQAEGTNPFFPELDLYPYFCLNASETEEMTFNADDYVEIRVPFGAEQDFYFDWTKFEVPYPRSAEIISPETGEVVSGLVSFEAILDDKDGDDNVQWAVRAGTCAASTNTVFGNVDGFNNDYDWDGENFLSSTDVSSWTEGEYCFVFNPTESSGDTPIRETRQFIVAHPPTDIDQCKKGGWEDFMNPSFDNQGKCVSYVKSNENAGIRSGDNPRGR